MTEWTCAPVSKKRVPDCEFAYMKAALEDQNNGDSLIAYEAMYGLRPKMGAPYWLVRLAIYYGALEIGYRRIGRKMPTIDARMASAVKALDESALKSNKDLWHHMYLHDVEPAEFGGRELVS